MADEIDIAAVCSRYRVALECIANPYFWSESPTVDLIANYATGVLDISGMTVPDDDAESRR